jgi:hypothetical protein
MKKRSFECSMCLQSFSRNNNAERHNERIHDGLATIYDTRLKDDSNVKIRSKNPVYQNRFKQMQLFSDLRSKKDNELFSAYLNFDDGNNNNKLKVMRVFGQLKPHFEELEYLLDKYDETIKEKIICQIIISCLTSYRPIKSLKDTIELYKSIDCMNKISYYFSKYNNISKEEARIRLEQLVQNSIYYKNNIN